MSDTPTFHKNLILARMPLDLYRAVEANANAHGVSFTEELYRLAWVGLAQVTAPPPEEPVRP